MFSSHSLFLHVYKSAYLLFCSFFRFDFDGNGLIDVYELQRLLHYLGVQCDQDYVNDLIEDSDRDHDGMLSFSEVSLFLRTYISNDLFSL